MEYWRYCAGAFSVDSRSKPKRSIISKRAALRYRRQALRAAPTRSDFLKSKCQMNFKFQNAKVSII